MASFRYRTSGQNSIIFTPTDADTGVFKIYKYDLNAQQFPGSLFREQFMTIKTNSDELLQHGILKIDTPVTILSNEYYIVPYIELELNSLVFPNGITDILNFNEVIIEFTQADNIKTSLLKNTLDSYPYIFKDDVIIPAEGEILFLDAGNNNTNTIDAPTTTVRLHKTCQTGVDISQYIILLIPPDTSIGIASNGSSPGISQFRVNIIGIDQGTYYEFPIKDNLQIGDDYVNNEEVVFGYDASGGIAGLALNSLTDVVTDTDPNNNSHAVVWDNTAKKWDNRLVDYNDLSGTNPIVGANVGAGTGLIFRDKTTNTLNFKSLIQGSNITLTNNADDIQIDATSAGETNLMANVGGFTNIYKDKTGVTFNLKTLQSSDSSLTITGNTDDINLQVPAPATQQSTLIDGGTVHTDTTINGTITDQQYVRRVGGSWQNDNLTFAGDTLANTQAISTAGQVGISNDQSPDTAYIYDGTEIRRFVTQGTGTGGLFNYAGIGGYFTTDYILHYVASDVTGSPTAYAWNDRALTGALTAQTSNLITKQTDGSGNDYLQINALPAGNEIKVSVGETLTDVNGWCSWFVAENLQRTANVSVFYTLRAGIGIAYGALYCPAGSDIMNVYIAGSNGVSTYNITASTGAKQIFVFNKDASDNVTLRVNDVQYFSGVLANSINIVDVIIGDNDISGGQPTDLDCYEFGGINRSLTSQEMTDLYTAIAVEYEMIAGGSTDADISLDNLNDVTITAASAHNVLKRNAGNTAWVNEAVDLSTTAITGTLAVANGGTGAVTHTSGNFLEGNGTSAVTATKAVPTGDVVGTTDAQTLTNKTINSSNNTITIPVADLSDTTITAVANDEVLTYSAGSWINQALPAATVDTSAGVKYIYKTSTPVANGQFNISAGTLNIHKNDADGTLNSFVNILGTSHGVWWKFYHRTDKSKFLVIQLGRAIARVDNITYWSYPSTQGNIVQGLVDGDEVYFHNDESTVFQLDHMEDVSDTAPADNQVIKWVAGSSEYQPVNYETNALTDVTLTSVADGNLFYNFSNVWVNRPSNDGQVKLNNGNGVQPTFVGLTAITEITYASPLGVSSFPTSSPPLNVNGGVFLDSHLYDFGAGAGVGKFQENAQLGQVNIWRIILNYSNKGLNIAGNISVQIRNPLSGFVAKAGFPLPEGVTGETDRYSEIISIADGASLQAPLGTGNGYIMEIESTTSVDVTITSIARINPVYNYRS